MTTYSSIEEAVAAGAKGTDRVSEPCAKCQGDRVIEEFYHVYDGICFACNGAGYKTVQVATVKARATAAAKKAAADAARVIAEAEAAAEKAAAYASWKTENAAFIATLEKLSADGIDFAKQLLNGTRIPTEKQIAAIDQIKTQRDTAIEVPAGRGTVTGKVVSVKSELDNFSYHERWNYKMLVEDDRGFRVFGTCPTDLLDAAEAAYDAQPELLDCGDWFQALKGQRVTFTATLEGKELGFGFFKRPAKASIIK